MKHILVPMQKILLECIMKVGKAVIFPGSDLENCLVDSQLRSEQIDLIIKIEQNNREKFRGILSGLSFLILDADYSEDEILNNPTVGTQILQNVNRMLDYTRIQQCLFSRPEYLMGRPGVIDGTQCFFLLDEDGKIDNVFLADKVFYSIQPGIGLDLGFHEFADEELYNAIYSERTDEVYLKYRSLLGDACEAMRILDINRCFVYLFSKVDRMGHCDTYHFTDNKKRIIACLAKNQEQFNIYSNQFYFYSKEIRTKIVHQGNHILNYVPIKKAYEVINNLFLLIVNFCNAIINTQITVFDDLDVYILKKVNEFVYEMPLIEEETEESIPALEGNKSVYFAEISNMEITDPLKLGNVIFLPKLGSFNYRNVYGNYVNKDLGGEYDEIYKRFTIEDMEYILEITKHTEMKQIMEKHVVAIIIKMPSLVEREDGPLGREYLCDYICNEIEKGYNYFILTDEECYALGVLPSKVGIINQIRLVYQYDEFTDDITPIPGRVYAEYFEPEEKYVVKENAVIWNPEIYEILYCSELNELKLLCKTALERICETYYISDWTIRISYLYDILDMLHPETTKSDKLLKNLLAFTCNTRQQYDNEKIDHELLRTKYRNPILHGGKQIWEITDSLNEIKELALKLELLITDYCVSLYRKDIATWEEQKAEYRCCQIRLGLIH